ncbi:MAG: thermonuclease family protein [Deltaproteobacteria bacterium]|nr:thermonuclease family protein [Deltaproteobacteria bacterium]
MKSTALLALLAALVACSPVGGDRYSRKQAQKSLQKLETPGVVLGEFRLTKVTDGDTVRVDGLDASLRLVGLDAEETFKNEADRRAVEAGWEQYLKDKKGTSNRPIKAASPMGEVAKEWAVKWFAGVDKVRVERDHPAEIRDRFNRYLAYVFAQKSGTWLNYNVEAVRAGMSPYFPKYGYSRRFHNEFVAAQDEARNGKRGIWAPGALAYPDYAEREAWWNARGAFMETFRNASKDKANYIDLTHWDAMKRLEEHVGKEVHVISTVSEVRIGERGPSRVTLSHRMFNDFPLIFFDKDVLGTSGITAWKSEFVVVTGVPAFYESKQTKKRQLQIVVDRASQITLSEIPGLVAPSAATTTASP